MYLLLSLMTSLLLTTIRSASAQSSILPAPTGLFPNTTVTRTPSKSTLSSDNILPIDGARSCTPTVWFITTLPPGGDVVTTFQTVTVTYTFTSTLPAQARPTASELLSPRGPILCFNCVRSSTQTRQAGALTSQDPIFKARQISPTTETEPVCAITFTTISLVTVTLPGVTSTLITTITVIEIVETPPRTLSSASSFSIEDSVAASSSGVSSQDASPAGFVAPVVQTPPASSTPATTTASPEESSLAEEGFPSRSDMAPSPINPTPPSTPERTISFASVSSNSAPQLVPFPQPSREQSGMETQVQGVQTPGLTQNQLPAGSTLEAVFSTQIPLQQSITAVAPAEALGLPTITLGTDTFAPAVSSSFYVINGQTLALGGTAITVSNSVLSLATTNGAQLVVVPANTVDNGPPIPATTIQLSPNPNQNPSSGPDGAPAPNPNPVIATIGTSAITLNPSASSLVLTLPNGFPITILPGAPALTLPGGTIVSIAPANPTTAPSPLSSLTGPVLIVSNPGAPSAQSIPFPTPVTTLIGTSPIILNPLASSLVFTPAIGPPLTLLPGSPAITLSDGTILSVSPTNPANPTTALSPSSIPIGGVLIISSPGASSAQSITFPTSPSLSLPTNQSPPPPLTTTPPYIPILISSPPFIVVGGTTLSPNGPAITISGIPVSFGTQTATGTGTSNSVLVVGSSTITIAPAETGIGGYLYSGLGGSGSGTSAVAVTTSPNSDPGRSRMLTSTLPTVPADSSSGSGSGLSSRSSGESQQPTPTSTATSTAALQATNRAVRHLSPWPWVRVRSRIPSVLLGLCWSLFVLRVY